MMNTQIDLLQKLTLIILTKNASKQKDLYLTQREIIKKKIKARKLLATFILRNKRRRMFRRSCWIQPELAFNIIGKYWEEQVPLYTGNVHIIN